MCLVTERWGGERIDGRTERDDLIVQLDVGFGPAVGLRRDTCVDGHDVHQHNDDQHNDDQHHDDQHHDDQHHDDQHHDHDHEHAAAADDVVHRRRTHQ